MRHTREHHSEHMRKLVAACDWLGIDKGRASQYGDLIREFYEKGARTKHHFLAFNESYEIVDLSELWEKRVADFPGLSGKIRAVLSKGPLLREEENSKASSNRARNDAFVYLVAGKFLASRIPVVAIDGILSRYPTCESNADLTLQWNDTLIDIECKRPQSLARLEERTKDARKQIKKRSHNGRFGVIAIDCSALIRPAGTLLERDSGEAAEKWLSAKLVGVGSKLQSYLTSSICGFLFFARVPAMIRVDRSPIVTAQGKPIYDLCLYSISTWLAVGNSKLVGPDVLQCLSKSAEANTQQQI